MMFPISMRLNGHALYVQEVSFDTDLLDPPFVIDALRSRGIWKGAYNVSGILPFFDGARVTEVPLHEWLKRPERRANRVGFVFHTSRCGSTMFSQAVKCLKSCRVLSEPPMLNAVLDIELELPDDVRSRLLRRSIDSMVACLPPEYDIALVKTRSWNVLRIQLFQRTFEDSRAIFIHRDPEDMVASIMASPPAWFRSIAIFAEFLGTPSPAMERLRAASVHEKCAFMVAAFTEAASQSQGMIQLFMRYGDIQDQLGSVLSRVWHVNPTVGEMERARQSFRYYSKSYPEKVLYDRTGISNAEQAASRVREPRGGARAGAP